MNKDEKINILMKNIGNKAWRAISANKFKFIAIISKENIIELIKCKNIFIESKISNINAFKNLWDAGGYRNKKTGIKAFNQILQQWKEMNNEKCPKIF